MTINIVHEMIQRLNQGGPDASEVALQLGLLLERSYKRRRESEPVQPALLPELVDVVLTRKEQTDVVEALIEYLDHDPSPAPVAAWALARSHRPDAVEALLRIVQSRAADPTQLQLAYQALAGLDAIPSWDAWRAIRNAAIHGTGQVQRTADQITTSVVQGLGDAITAAEQLEEVVTWLEHQPEVHSRDIRRAVRAARTAIQAYSAIGFPVERSAGRELRQRLRTLQTHESPTELQLLELRRITVRIRGLLMDEQRLAAEAHN